MTIPESGISRRRGRGNTIEVKLQEFEQLFNTIDPSPFHEKDLDHDLEEFIVSWAKEYPLHEPLRFIVHLEQRPPDADPQVIIERAVHNYFDYKTGLNQREFKLLMREGRLSMMIGLLFLSACLSGAQLASTRHIPGARVVEASLTIAGWVAMWHPMDIYLYGWWPLRPMGKVFRKLSIIPVEVRYHCERCAVSSTVAHLVLVRRWAVLPRRVVARLLQRSGIGSRPSFLKFSRVATGAARRMAANRFVPTLRCRAKHAQPLVPHCQ